MPSTTATLFTPVTVGTISAPNRLVVAPMSRVSATRDGVPTPAMATYYERFARGGFGTIVTEGIHTDDHASRAYACQPGLVHPGQTEAWRSITAAVHAAGGRIVAQLMHAGALSQCSEETIAPSSVPPRGRKMEDYGGTGPFPLPRAATQDDLEAAVEGFASAAAHAVSAGFDGVEIHGANGYLVDQFLTDYTNLRTDRFGGDVHGRVRLAVDVIRRVRATVGPDHTVGIRLSQTKVNDTAYRWPGGRAEAEAIFTATAEAGVDYLHLASEGRDWRETAGFPDGSTITGVAREVTGLPVIANGGLGDPVVAADTIARGDADLVSVGKAALANPDLPLRVQRGEPLEPFEKGLISPSADLDNEAEFRASRRLTSA
jgi:2,4-dienoyl-CoA reductase-like NADH-dependent reductase (Old Yellow Enzyme family)